MNKERLEPLLDKPDQSFNDVADIISKLVTSHGVNDSDGSEVIYPGWDGSVSNLALEPKVAEVAQLGDNVRVRVIGDYLVGVALVMRSRNVFNSKRYGFYIQPTVPVDGKSRGAVVLQGPAFKPERGKVYWGFELLDQDQVQEASTDVAQSLIRSLCNNTR